MMSQLAKFATSKKRKLNQMEDASSSANQSASGSLLLTLGSAEPGDGNQLLPREFERLALSIDPDFLQKTKDAKIIGFERPVAQRLPNVRYYQINLNLFRSRIKSLFSTYLKKKLYAMRLTSENELTDEVETISNIVVDACCAALYAKLRNIHRQFQTHATRYTTPPSFNKEVELPLPFADAIQNFGVFSPIGTTSSIICVPTYQEGTMNEGRLNQVWESYRYEFYLERIKEAGIPTKTVDIHSKPGNSWWLFKYVWFHDHYDLRCMYPPINYSDHVATVAMMFAEDSTVPNQPAPQLLNTHETDVQYPYRMMDNSPNSQHRAFAALCHAPREEWNEYLLF
jgi:hypothetical protein